MRRVPETHALLALSVLTGILCGLAAVGLKWAIHALQHGLTGLFPDSRWPFLVLPGIGMLLSLLIVRYLVRDNIGHGVTKVLQAVSKNESKIKRHNIWSSLVTSALTIGFGGSVGAEAPIVYTGAAIGSNLGRYSGMSYRGMTLLLGCGAAGAVAGIFSAPLAGVLFTLEILLFNLSMSGILPLLLSSISATLVSYLILGQGNSPFAATIQPFSLHNVPAYILLGVLCALFALYFIRTTLSMEDRLGRVKNPYLRWAVSAASLGILIFLFPRKRPYLVFPFGGCCLEGHAAGHSHHQVAPFREEGEAEFAGFGVILEVSAQGSQGHVVVVFARGFGLVIDGEYPAVELVVVAVVLLGHRLAVEPEL